MKKLRSRGLTSLPVLALPVLGLLVSTRLLAESPHDGARPNQETSSGSITLKASASSSASLDYDSIHKKVDTAFLSEESKLKLNDKELNSSTQASLLRAQLGLAKIKSQIIFDISENSRLIGDPLKALRNPLSLLPICPTCLAGFESPSQSLNLEQISKGSELIAQGILGNSQGFGELQSFSSSNSEESKLIKSALDEVNSQLNLMGDHLKALQKLSSEKKNNAKFRGMFAELESDSSLAFDSIDKLMRVARAYCTGASTTANAANNSVTKKFPAGLAGLQAIIDKLNLSQGPCVTHEIGLRNRRIQWLSNLAGLTAQGGYDLALAKFTQESSDE